MKEGKSMEQVSWQRRWRRVMMAKERKEGRETGCKEDEHVREQKGAVAKIIIISYVARK